MRTDTIFTELCKRWPRTLFELLGEPPEQVQDFQFDAVEIKKSLRLDALFRPKRSGLPAYFVKFQFYHLPTFYANLFAKVFVFLNDNPEVQDWHAIALFGSRRFEPVTIEQYDDLLNSKRVKRLYLDEMEFSADPPLGLAVLQMVIASKSQLPELVKRVIAQAKRQFPNRGTALGMIELVEEILICRFDKLKREEIRKMFHLADIRKTAVWREASEEGRKEGRQEGRQEGVLLAKEQIIRNCLANQMPLAEIAVLVELSVKDVRRLAKKFSDA